MSLDFSLEGQVWGRHSSICILSPVNPMGPTARPMINQEYRLPQRKKPMDLLTNPRQKWLSCFSSSHCTDSALDQASQPHLQITATASGLYSYQSCQSDISRHTYDYVPLWLKPLLNGFHTFSGSSPRPLNMVSRPPSGLWLLLSSPDHLSSSPLIPQPH